MELFDSEELSNQTELVNEEQPKQEEQEQPVAEKPEESPKIPDKYKGKSLEDIVAMHQEAEKLIGRQAQEVGEVRRLADELIKQQLGTKQQLPPQEENEVDFFENPQKAVQKAVESHPDVLAAKQAALQLKQIKAQAALNQAHPDYAQVVQDPEFVEWVKGSPYRLNMFAMANAQYDYAAANELLSTFKQIRGTKTKETVNTGKEVLKKDLKAAAVDVSGTGESSKKVYRRADLIRLKMTDPARYEALQSEIMAAYAEGRVK